MERQFNLNILA
jgi:hypothetical protein